MGAKKPLWHQLDDRVPLSNARSAASPAEHLKTIVVRTSTCTGRPGAHRMLADELMTPTSISGALSESGNSWAGSRRGCP
jgi:hypothetical protein